MDPCNLDQLVSTTERTLTDAEKEKLKKDTNLVSSFKQNKLQVEAQKNWDLFYKRNSTNFFKDRHWITREFPELLVLEDGSRILEVGCGCGNTVFPLMEENGRPFYMACDFSPRAVEFVKKNPNYNEKKCKAFQCDITKDDLLENVEEQSVDIVSLFFVMSAIIPKQMDEVIKNVSKVVKPGGLIIFRDYGLYDHAMIRFAPGHKLDEHLYVRQDGTRSFFFSCDETKELFGSNGFEIEQNTYVFKRTVNVKEEKNVPRVFVQGKYRKKI